LRIHTVLFDLDGTLVDSGQDIARSVNRTLERLAVPPLPEADRPLADITEAYHRARREVFATCPRVVLAARPGEALLVHRLALHGISPWVAGAKAPARGRIIAYFRPCLASIGDWLAHEGQGASCIRPAR
jgi:hypothetical protein